MNTIVDCKVCGKPFEREVKRGRPAVRCLTCRELAATNNHLELKSIPASDAIPTIEDTSTDVDDNLEVSEAPRPTIKPKEVNNTPYAFRLMVGNLGLAYGGDIEVEALTAYKRYCHLSSQGFGQVGFERVQLWKLNSEQSYELSKDFDPRPELSGV